MAQETEKEAEDLSHPRARLMRPSCHQTWPPAPQHISYCTKCLCLICVVYELKLPVSLIWVRGCVEDAWCTMATGAIVYTLCVPLKCVGCNHQGYGIRS